MADLRESIRNFIEDLPNMLSRVKDYSTAFDDSRAMHECSADLYIVSNLGWSGCRLLLCRTYLLANETSFRMPFVHESGEF